MADYRDPTIPAGMPADRAAADRVAPPTGRGGMSRWIWIGGAAVVALLLLMMMMGGGDDVAPAVGDAVVTEPAAPATVPAAPAPAPQE